MYGRALSWESYFKFFKYSYHGIENPKSKSNIKTWWFLRLVKHFGRYSGSPEGQKQLELYATSGSALADENEKIEEGLSACQNDFGIYKSYLTNLLSVVYRLSIVDGTQEQASEEKALALELKAFFVNDNDAGNAIKKYFHMLGKAKSSLALLEEQTEDDLDQRKMNLGDTLVAICEKRLATVAERIRDFFPDVFRKEVLYAYLRNRAVYEVMQQHYLQMHTNGKGLYKPHIYFRAFTMHSLNIFDMNMPSEEFERLIEAHSRVPFVSYHYEAEFPAMAMPTFSQMIGWRICNPVRWVDFAADFTIGNLSRGWCWLVNKLESCCSCCNKVNCDGGCCGTEKGKEIRGYCKEFGDFVLKLPGVMGMSVCTSLHVMAKWDYLVQCCKKTEGCSEVGNFCQALNKDYRVSLEIEEKAEDDLARPMQIGESKEPKQKKKKLAPLSSHLVISQLHDTSQKNLTNPKSPSGKAKSVSGEESKLAHHIDIKSTGADVASKEIHRRTKSAGNLQSMRASGKCLSRASRADSIKGSQVMSFSGEKQRKLRVNPISASQQVVRPLTDDLSKPKPAFTRSMVI
jgi:hypothetical protein